MYRQIALVVMLSAVWATGSLAQSPPFLLAWGGNGQGDGQFSAPRGLTVDATGNVYVTDYCCNSRIEVFTSNGTFVRKWGSNGTAPGQFTQPEDIAIDSQGNVYVSDSGRDRIQKFDNAGALITSWGSFGSGPGQFSGASGIAIDASDNVYVVDMLNCRVQKFTSGGGFLLQWGSCGGGDGQFNLPYGIAVSGSGTVYVADRLNNRIERFTSGGSFLGLWNPASLIGHPAALDLDSSGRLYVTTEDGKVTVLTSAGDQVVQWGSAGTGDGQFSDPLGVAIGLAGEVFVSDTGNQRVQKFGAVPTPTLHSSWGQLKQLYR